MLYYKKLFKNLIENKISVSVAESCTGGKLSKSFTDINGISKIFEMGLITYSNSAKEIILNIPSKIIEKKGAVSQEVAELMVKNLFKLSKSRLCISTTGIAGPSGGSKNKPVGLVFICIMFDKKIFLFKKKFHGSRSEIQNKTINFCFEEIKKLI